MPFKINSLTENVNPIELREYLAACFSVVPPPLPEAQAYGHVVRFARSAEEFIRALDKAVLGLSDGPSVPGKRRVSKETWVAWVDQIFDLVMHRIGKNCNDSLAKMIPWT